MKKKMTGLMAGLLGVMLLGGTAMAQIRKIPATVTEAFKQKFPEATQVEWKDKLTAFEASYKIGEAKYQSDFSAKGEWKQTEKPIEDEDLPAEVKEGLDKSKYKDWQIKSSTLLETPDGQSFIIVVQKAALQKKRLSFSYDGQLIKELIVL